MGEGDENATDIDEPMQLACRHPIGPLALADLIGLDVLLSVMHTPARRIRRSEVPGPHQRSARVAAGYLGGKSGRGVYRY